MGLFFMNKKITRRYLFVVIPIVLVIAIIICVISYLHKKDIAFYVNGYPIYTQEVNIVANKIKLQQRQLFAKKSGQSLQDLDFSKEVDGKTGYEYYAKAVIDELKRIKVLQIDSKKNGIYDNIDYIDIKKEMESINKNRLDDKLQGKVVYGVVQYDEEQYYDYINSNLYLQNQRYLEKNNIITATEEEKRKKYNEDPTKFDLNKYEDVQMFVKNVVLTEKYQKYIKELEEKANITGSEKVVDIIKKII